MGWDKIHKLEAEIEAVYSQWWIAADKSQATVDKIAAIKKAIGDGRAFNFGTPARVKNVLKKAGIAVGALEIVGFIGESIALGNYIVNPPPHVKATFDEVLRQYGIVYRQALYGTPTKHRWFILHDAVNDYLSAAGYSAKVKSLIDAHFVYKGAQLH